MPKERTFCYYWQRPRLNLCRENKSEAFVSVTEFGKWALSTAHAVFVNGGECVCHCHRQVALSSGAKAPQSCFSCFPNPTNTHILSASALPAVSNTSTADLSPQLVETSKCFAAFTAGWLCHFLAIHVLIIVREHRERSRGCFAYSSLSSHQFLNDYNNQLNSGKSQLKSLSHQLFKLGHQSCLYFLSSSLWCWILFWFFFSFVCFICL